MSDKKTQWNIRTYNENDLFFQSLPSDFRVELGDGGGRIGGENGLSRGDHCDRSDKKRR